MKQDDGQPNVVPDHNEANKYPYVQGLNLPRVHGSFDV